MKANDFEFVVCVGNTVSPKPKAIAKAEAKVAREAAQKKKFDEQFRRFVADADKAEAAAVKMNADAMLAQANFQQQRQAF